MRAISTFVLLTALTFLIAPRCAIADEEGIDRAGVQRLWWFDAGPRTASPAEQNAKRDLETLFMGAFFWSAHRILADDMGVADLPLYYPDSIDSLVQDFGVQITLEENDFAIASVDFPCGWTEHSANHYTYLKQYDESGNVTGFVLLGYGSSAGDGYDISGDGLPDGVVSLLSNETVQWQGKQEFRAHGQVVTIDFAKLPRPSA